MVLLPLTPRLSRSHQFGREWGDLTVDYWETSIVVLKLYINVVHRYIGKMEDIFPAD